MLHGTRTNGKAHGVVNTKASVVCKMLDLVGFSENEDLRNVSILEPSAGVGAFAIEIINRLYQSSVRFDFNFEEALSNIYLCELDTDIAIELRNNITHKLEQLNIRSNKIVVIVGDFLQSEFNKDFDLVIGNPPYVRNENIPDSLKRIYESKFTTFSHRSDLYVPFYEKGLISLNPGGVLSYVCSNRWLKNQYGKRLRELIRNNFNVDIIIDLEDADIFEEEVLGYPAVTNISKRKKQTNAQYFKVDDLTSFLQFDDRKVEAKTLNLTSSNWFSYSYTGASYEKNLKPIEQQNYKIGIGVATGRDSIFISKEFQGIIERDILMPILTSKDVKGLQIEWQGNYIINPFDKTGNLIDLDDYPLAKKYLNLHKNELSNRHVAKKDSTKWYKTIDKIHYRLKSKPKVILPDISGNRFIHVDNGNYYPHHNLYYVTGGDYNEMCLVASILMSDFVYEQLLSIGNKMNGGYPRWQSQNLRKLLMPIINSVPADLKDCLLKAYNQKDLNSINQIMTKENISKFEVSEGQLTLFEPQAEFGKRNLNIDSV